MLMKVWFLPSLWLLLLGGHHEFIFHLFSSLSSSRQVCALPFPSWNFKCYDNNCARQADWAGGVKIQMLCMWQTQRRPFCGLRFDLIRWEIKWHLTGCQIMPSVIFGCISWLHLPCLTWGNHPEVCQKWHWISRPQGNNMDISMEKAMSLSHIWLKRWNRGNLRVLSIASPLYLDGKMTVFCSNGLFSFSCCTMTTFFDSFTNQHWMNVSSKTCRFLAGVFIGWMY